MQGAHKLTEKKDLKREERRNLQMTGGSTYILSLPKEWVTRNHLQKGNSIVLLEEDDGSLSLFPSMLEKQEKKNEALIRVSPNDNPDAVMRKTISAYLVGYGMLHIRGQGQQPLAVELRNYLKSFARSYLVGTEIVTDSPTELTLQILLNYPELSVESALRRMAIIAGSMHREAVACLASLDYSAAKAVVETDREVNRFSLYILRLLKMAVTNIRLVKEIGLSNPRECLGYRIIAKSVERTADHATKIAENMLSLKNPVNPDLLRRISSLSSLAVSMFESSVEALFRHDYLQAESVIEKISQIHKLEKEAVISSQAVKIEEIPSIRLLIESIRRTAEYASDISEVVLNLNVESVLT
jgi:phosphate uptake regulator